MTEVVEEGPLSKTGAFLAVKAMAATREQEHIPLVNITYAMVTKITGIASPQYRKLLTSSSIVPNLRNFFARVAGSNFAIREVPRMAAKPLSG